IAFYTQAKAMGLDKRTAMYSVSGTIEAIAPDDIEGAAEGVYIAENFPRMLKYKDDPFHKEHNRLVEIDDVDAREFNSKRVMAKSHAWQSWENMFALKQAIEASGYRTRKDTAGVIQALEGQQMKNSIGHPQGDKLIRREDHCGIVDAYISRVEKGRLEVKKRIPKEDLARQMPVRHDLSKMPV
ncbi:MAG: ABC transporter substrate-binding protein, partial [Betaproteobacteria bacterium]